MLRAAIAALVLAVIASSAYAMPDPPPLEDYVPPPPSEPMPPPEAPRPYAPYAPVYGPAVAYPTPGLPPTPERTKTYGWKVILSDGVAVAIALAGIAAEPARRPEDDGDYGAVFTGGDALILISMAWWSTITPLVHLSEGNGRGAAVSYGLRYALPIAGVLVGHAFDKPDSSSDTGALYGLAVGALAASIIDITWNAQKTERGGSLWIPGIMAGPNGFRVSIGRPL